MEEQIKGQDDPKPVDPYQSPKAKVSSAAPQPENFWVRHSRFWPLAVVIASSPLLITMLLHDTDLISTTELEEINTFVMPIAIIAAVGAFKLRGKHPTRRRRIMTVLTTLLAIAYLGIYVAYAVDRSINGTY